MTGSVGIRVCSALEPLPLCWTTGWTKPAGSGSAEASLVHRCWGWIGTLCYRAAQMARERTVPSERWCCWLHARESCTALQTAQTLELTNQFHWFFFIELLWLHRNRRGKKGLFITLNIDHFATFALGLVSNRPGVLYYLSRRHFLLIVCSFFKNLYQYCRYQFLRGDFVKLGCVLSF